MPRTPQKRTVFGRRLHAIRQARGMTQVALAEAAGMSQRMVSHYECEIENPTAEMVVRLAKALKVSTDELLGVRTPRKIDEGPNLNPQLRRYWKRVQQLAQLPERDQRSVLRMLDNTIKAHGGG
ncbi:MAG: helix-turn-helix transcriptional regulator [Spiribacter salinus]|uniref:Helix-turn-helix transcriptional regulator n=1 Tax=Spiribacter salinus TaxID=1335746 RepID=A0A540VEZ7_9GAMM|nr:MAG: helix-turn-helix transcriptional regulator [Spiribacter salinus]